MGNLIHHKGVKIMSEYTVYLKNKLGLCEYCYNTIPMKSKKNCECSRNKNDFILIEHKVEPYNIRCDGSNSHPIEIFHNTNIYPPL